MLKIIIILAITILCVSCVTNPIVGTRIDLDDVNETVSNQTNIEEPAEYLGPSNLASVGVDDPSVYQWRYPKPGFGGTSDALVVILFDDHGVMTRVYHWGSRTNTDKFDLIDVNKLIHSKTTIEEAAELLGLPNRARVRIDGSSVYWWHGSNSRLDRATAAAPILFDD
jgi:hypothetical protein